MFSSELRRLVQAGSEGLAMATSSYRNIWGFGQEERWEVSQDEGKILFFFADKLVSAPVQIIGSLNLNDKTWLWAWANASVDPQLAANSLKIKGYGEQHNLRKLILPKWKASESDGWSMTALAVRLCGAGGGYRGRVDNLWIYMSFDDVTIDNYCAGQEPG